MAQTDVNNDYRDEMFDGDVSEKFLYEIYDDDNRVVVRGESDN